MTPVHPYGPRAWHRAGVQRACVPGGCDNGTRGSRPQAGGHPTPWQGGRGRPQSYSDCLGFPRVMGWSSLGTSCSCAAGRQESGLLTRGLCSVASVGQAAKGNTPWLGSLPHAPKETRISQPIEQQRASLPPGAIVVHV